MSTSNEKLLDAALKRVIEVRALSNQEVRVILRLLSLSNDRLIQLIWKHDPESITSTRSRAYRALVNDITELRKRTMEEIRRRITGTLKELGPVEAEAERRAILLALPLQARVVLEIELPSPNKLVADALKEPFSGGRNAARTLDDWFRLLEAADQRRIVEALALGISQGESAADMIKRLRGTRAAGYRNGILAAVQANAEALVRTAMSHVHNSAREALWAANDEVIAGLYWVSTLDGRTSAICRARDGQVDMQGGLPVPKGHKKLTPPGARPPAHPNCRSVMVAMLDHRGILDRLGERPYVTFDDVGTLPAKTTYDEFLRRQSIEFQEHVLGKTKAKIFREDGITLDKFVDRRGRELTIKELQNR